VRAVSAVIVRPDGRVLLVRRTKPPLEGVLTLPGGRVEPGETLAAAAVREVREETSLEVVIVAHVTDVEIPETPTTPPYSIAVHTTRLVSDPDAARAASDAAELVWCACGVADAAPDPLVRLQVPAATRDAIRAAMRASGQWPR